MVVLLQCLVAGTATAQKQCTGGTVLGVVGYYHPFVGQTCEPWGNGVPLLVCWAVNTACAPYTAPQETFCPECAGSPIRLANGQTFIEQTDLSIPGLSNGLNLVRTWISIRAWPASQSPLQPGIFGGNWRSTYEERVFLGNDGYLRYARGDGSIWSFGGGYPGWAVVAPRNAGATLVQQPDSWPPVRWVLTLKNGEHRFFDINSGSLTTIIDRNGNTTQLTYDGLNRLVTVTDPASRSLTFTYASNTSYLVTGVTSSVGLSLSYAYDTYNR